MAVQQLQKKKHFRPEYRYRAWPAGIKEKIIEMTLNSAGVRDTGRRSGIILAWHNGKRQDKDFLTLGKLLKAFPTSKYHTDDWGAYSKYIPPGKHRIGKDRTWKTERKNLNFRTHLKRLNRKTICFSKNKQIHDNVIGMYIEKYYDKTGIYGNNSP